MSTQRYIYFRPASEEIAIYREDESGFRYGITVKVADLSAPQQLVVSAALAWQAAQFDEDEALEQVIFEPYAIADNPEATEEDESGIGLKGAATGRKAGAISRERTLTNDSADLPGDLRAGLIALWQSLAAIPDPA